VASTNLLVELAAANFLWGGGRSPLHPAGDGLRGSKAQWNSPLTGSRQRPFYCTPSPGWSPLRPHRAPAARCGGQGPSPSRTTPLLGTRWPACTRLSIAPRGHPQGWAPVAGRGSSMSPPRILFGQKSVPSKKVFFSIFPFEIDGAFSGCLNRTGGFHPVPECFITISRPHRRIQSLCKASKRLFNHPLFRSGGLFSAVWVIFRSITVEILIRICFIQLCPNMLFT